MTTCMALCHIWCKRSNAFKESIHFPVSTHRVGNWLCLQFSAFSFLSWRPGGFESYPWLCLFDWLQVLLCFPGCFGTPELKESSCLSLLSCWGYRCVPGCFSLLGLIFGPIRGVDCLSQIVWFYVPQFIISSANSYEEYLSKGGHRTVYGIVFTYLLCERTFPGETQCMSRPR